MRASRIEIAESQTIVRKWYSGFRTGDMKGARWMPRLATAMKDATNQRNASGRRFVAFDPEVSEWGNPASNGHPPFKEWSSPREVKHLSTWRKRKQQRVVFRLLDASSRWNATLVIP